MPPSQGEKNGSAKLTESQVIEARALYAAGGVSQRALAAEFGVGVATINSIVNGESWAYV